MSEGLARAVERLELDFNHRDARGRVRIGPAALDRIPALRDRQLRPGVRVLVVDDDGNRCQGVLREDLDQPAGHRLSVELDPSTWVDADEPATGVRHLAHSS